MALSISPSIAVRSRIEADVGADISPCWTCSTCDQECPVNRATGRLRPQKVVRLAALGLMDEAISLPEIWYCLTCRRCTGVCPNQVKPESLIQHLRAEALRRGRISVETYRRLKNLFMQIQRARFQLAADLFRGETVVHEAQAEMNWFQETVPAGDDHSVVFVRQSSANGTWQADIGRFQTAACFTCSECSNACPISGDRKVFDPQWIFRMANLGQAKSLLTSASIWLCIQCGRCSDTCGQLVQGRQLIEFLQQKAITDGYVPADFPLRWSQAQSWIYSEYIREVDSLLSPSR